MRNIVTIFLFVLISAITASSSYAWEMVSPRKGEGPVQIAERIGVSPKKFIELNLRLGNFKYPKRVSLIYTWQKFAVPEIVKHKKPHSVAKVQKVRATKIAKKMERTLQLRTERGNIEIKESKPVTSNFHGEFKKNISDTVAFLRRQNFSTAQGKIFSMKIYRSVASMVIGLAILLGIAWWHQERLRKKILMQDDMYRFGLFPPRKPINKWRYKHKREQDSIHVVCCSETGNFVVITGNSHYRTQDSGESGLMGIRDFIRKVHEKEELEYIRFEVPQSYQDTCRSLTKEERNIFQDFVYKKRWF